MNNIYKLLISLFLTPYSALSHNNTPTIEAPKYSTYFSKNPILEDCFEFNKTGKPLQMVVLPRRGTPYTSNNCSLYENLMKLHIKDISAEVKSVLIIYPATENGEKRFRQLHFDDTGKLHSTEEGIGRNVSGKRTLWHHGTICLEEEQVCSGNPFAQSYTWQLSGFSFKKNFITGIEKFTLYKNGAITGNVIHIATKQLELDNDIIIKPSQVVAEEFYVNGKLFKATYLPGTKYQSTVSGGNGTSTTIISPDSNLAISIAATRRLNSLYIKKASICNGKKNGSFSITEYNHTSRITHTIISGTYNSDELICSKSFSENGTKIAKIEWHSGSPISLTYLWELETPRSITTITKECTNEESSISIQQQCFNRCGIQTAYIIRDTYGRIKHAIYRDELGNIISTIDNYSGQEREINEATGEIITLKY